jgi:hypothetical protein
MPDAIVVLWAAVAIVAIIAVFARPKPTPPATVPEDAASIGPNDYMRAWREGNRIKIVFRNIPEATVAFDCRAAREFAEWLQQNGDIGGEGQGSGAANYER